MAIIAMMFFMGNPLYEGRLGGTLKKIRILCIRCDRIGDLLASTPVLHRLRKLYPAAEINMITSPAGRLALVDNPDIDNVYIYNKKSLKSWFALFPLLFKVHDLVIGFNAGSKTIRLLAALARGRKKGFLQTGNLAPWSGDPEVAGHISAEMLRGLEAEFALPHDEHPDIQIRFHVPEVLKKEVFSTFPKKEGLKRVGLFIGNISQPKLRWPIEKFVEFSSFLLARNPGLELYVVAGKADVPLLSSFKGIAEERLHIFVGDVSLQHTTAFIGTCDAFVTSSSSPQHLAASVGLPIVSIVHPRSHERWAPQGPLNFSAISQTPYDVREVTLKQVYEALNKSMQGYLVSWKD